jgi:hypothetical protein
MKNNIVTSLSITLAGTGMVLASSSFSTASGASFTGSSGSLSASASFERVNGNQLQITLTNTGGADVTVPADVLTGIFFKMDNPLTAVSATLGAGSQAVYNGAVVASSTDVSNGWAYNGSLSLRGGNQGISAAGLGLFGPSNVIGSDTNGVQGLDYGLLSLNDNIATGNTGVKKQTLFKNSVSFLFNGLGSNIDLATAISSVSFQYGTATSEPSIIASLLQSSTPPASPAPVAVVPSPEPASPAPVAVVPSTPPASPAPVAVVPSPEPASPAPVAVVPSPEPASPAPVAVVPSTPPEEVSNKPTETVPEPTTILGTIFGLGSLFAARRRQNNK